MVKQTNSEAAKPFYIYLHIFIFPICLIFFVCISIFLQPALSADKKRTRLRLHLGKFAGDKKSLNPNAGSGFAPATGSTTLGLVEGNSTNTVNTVEDTEFSSSNVDSKSRAGVEVTTVFSNNTDEVSVDFILA